MTKLPTLSRLDFPTLLNITSKRLRLAVALALMAIGVGAVISASSGSLGSLLFRDPPAARGIVENAHAELARSSLIANTRATLVADGQLNIARRGHSATLLSDGKVLVIGGENASGFVTAAELFDPASGNFSVSGNLGTPRADHTATRLSDGRVLIAGGRGDLGPLSSTEIFDPATGAFTAGPDLIGARSGHTATTLVDGRIVLAGGDGTGSLELYDPVSNVFVLTGATMLTPRGMHSAALLPDGRILFVGGNDVSGIGLQSAEIFNPADTSLSATGGGMEHDRVHAFLRVLHDGKVQVIGGTHDDSIEIYDPAADVFGGHGHLIPVDDPHAALLHDDILSAPTRAALFHNGQADSLLDRSGHTITELFGSSQALVAGGANSGGSVLNSASLLRSSAATISTDKLDYAPGRTALITGTGWQPGETVDIVMHEDPHTHTERRLSLVADNEGKIIGSYFVEQHDSNVHFVVGAKGLTSRRTAQSAFTDTDPTPQTIPYSQDFSALPPGGAGSTTYPPGWQGWQLSTSGSSTSFRISTATGDLPLNAGSSASTTTGGVHNYNGKIGILATGSSDPSLALSINTTGHSNVTMSFDLMTIRNAYDGGSNTRISQVDLQYRVGTTGSFTSVSGLTNGIYQNNTTTQTGAGVTTPQKSESKSFILPSAVDNQAVVQLRWVQRDVSGGGSRPGFAVDNIVITVASPGSLQFSAANYNDPETDSGTHTKTILVQRTGGSGGAVDVNYATSDGTATLAGDDYLASFGTLHWNDGDSADKTFAVTVKGNTTFEPDETINLTLSGPTGGAIISGTNPTTLTIQNDDTAPAISVADVPHNESNAGTISYDFTVSLSNASYQTVTVDYATANETATAPSDYTAVPTTTLTFLPGETSVQVSVSVNGDTTFEANETFFVNLSNEANATISDSQGVGTIQNDDAQPSISIGDLSQAEGNAGTSSFDFAVTLSNPSDQTITVHYTTTDGTATQPSDYSSAGGTVTFMPGATSEAVSASVNGDTTFEGDETFTVNLDTPTNSTIADGTGLGTLQNDDSQPTVQFALASSSGPESASPVHLAVNLSNDSFEAVTVNYTVNVSSTATGGGVDYTLLGTGTLTFSPGETSHNVSLTVNDDSLDEPDETVVVDLSVPVNATLGATTQHTYTIQDNDNEPTVSIDDVTLTEGNSPSTTTATFHVTLSAPSGKTITLHYATADDTAVQPGDYTSTSGDLTFTPGQTAKTVDVTVKGDDLDEVNETYFVNLSALVNLNSVGNDTQGVGTITDDDSQPGFSIDDVSHNEGNSGTTSYTFTVTKSGTTSLTTKVDYATVDGSATAPSDYTAITTSTLTFAPEDATKTVTVLVNGDMTFEPDETFTVHLSNPANATISDADGTGTITNDDAQPSLAINDVTANEGNSGTTNFVFTVTKTGTTALSATMDFATANGTATLADSDYQANSGTLTFAASETTKTITVLVNGDTKFETSETFNVILSNPTNATISDNQGVGTITNDDAQPSFVVNDVIANEGNSGTTNFVFTVTKTGTTALSATMDFATANGTTNPATGGGACGTGIDYMSQNGTLTFAPTDTMMTVTVTVCGETLDEANETFFVNLSGATNAGISDNQGVGTITNDDTSLYNFEGFFAPVDNPPIVNTVKAGSAVPVKWRLTNAGIAPVSDPNSFVGLFSYQVSCGTTDGLEAPVETVAPGGSGLQYLDNGNWQINWKTLPNYPRGSCRVVELRLSDGTSHYAHFKFK